MRKQRSIATVTAVLAVGLIALTGCSTPSGSPTQTAPGSKGEIDFFTASTQIQIVNGLSADVASYFESRGYKVVVQDASFDPVKQGQQIQQAIDTHSIVGAWVFPVAPETLAQSIAAFQKAGIPAVIEGPPTAFGFTGPQKGLAFDAPDFLTYGARIGDLSGTCASKSSAHGALFLTPPDSTGGQAAVVGAIKTAFSAAAPAVPIVGTAAVGDIASAQSAVSKLLIAHPDADVVIATTDETALGAVGAFKAANKTPLCVVAGGGAPDTIAAQKAGSITAVVAWDYVAAVDKLGASLDKLIAAPTTEGDIVQTALKVTN